MITTIGDNMDDNVVHYNRHININLKASRCSANEIYNYILLLL